MLLDWELSDDNTEHCFDDKNPKVKWASRSSQLGGQKTTLNRLCRLNRLKTLIVIFKVDIIPDSLLKVKE